MRNGDAPGPFSIFNSIREPFFDQDDMYINASLNILLCRYPMVRGENTSLVVTHVASPFSIR